MQPIRIFFVAFLLFLTWGCAKDKKYVESLSPYCQSNMVKNQFIVHWKDKSPSLVVEKDLDRFIRENRYQIDFVEPNYTVLTGFVKKEEEPIVVDPAPDESTNTVYDMIHVRSAWYRGYFGQGLTVAVVDTGIDIKHPTLRRRLVPGWNFVSDSDIQSDETGHGTAMAGIITGPYLNGSSLSLAPDVKILPLDFMTENGGTEFHAQQAIAYAIAHRAQVINNSWTVNCSELLRNSFVAWSGENVIFINSSGNEPVDVIEHEIIPASLSLANHIHVGSLDERGHKSSFSGFGQTVHVFAPGELVPSIAQSNSGSHGIKISGTSASTAIVSAAVALLWSAYPQASANQIVALIIEGALQEPSIEPTLNVQQSLLLGRQIFGN